MIISTVYSRNDCYVVFAGISGAGIHVNKASKDGAEVAAYLAAHPEALVPEHVPPPPTPAQLAAQRRQGILAEIAALDAKTMRPMRAGEMDRVAEIEAQVIALRAELAAL